MTYEEIKKALENEGYGNILHCLEKNDSINREAENGGDCYTLSISDTFMNRVNGKVMASLTNGRIYCYPLGCGYDYAISIDMAVLSYWLGEEGEEELCKLDNYCSYLLEDESIEDDYECYYSLRSSIINPILKEYKKENGVSLTDEEEERGFYYLYDCKDDNSEEIFYDEKELEKAIKEGYERPY